MTRLAILADIHGNLTALEAVLADLEGEGVEQIVVASDLIQRGPFSAAVLDRAAEGGWPVIRGNGEYYLLDYGTPRAPADWAHPVEAAGIAWLHEQLAGRYRARIATWPDALSLRHPDAPPLCIVHGSPRSPWEGLYPATPAEAAVPMLAGVAEEAVVTAHTHLPLDRTIGRWRVFNPGSVGQPLDGRHAASYLLLDGDERGWRPTFRRVAYDVEPLLAELERQGFVERCGVIGQLIVREFATARTHLGPFRRWRSAVRPGEPLTPALLDEFSALDPEPWRSPHHRLPLAAADP